MLNSDTLIMGETLHSEWVKDPHAGDLWDCLRLTEREPEIASEGIARLAAAGSTLSMLYLGDISIHGRYHQAQDLEKAEFWLRSAFNGGSLEGGFLLARLLQELGRVNEACSIHQQLAERNYSPSMYVLGVFYSLGTLIQKDTEKGRYYFERGAARGHLPSAQWLSYLYRSGEFGFLKKIYGEIKRIILLPLFI